jgi:FKBP-type peptidyl-prolyl cis-trans isomerase FkpA
LAAGARGIVVRVSAFRFRFPCSVALLSVLLVGLGACGHSPTAADSYATYSQTDLVVGTGDTAIGGRSVTVNYTGWLYDGGQTNGKGIQFETSVGSTPFTFTLGAGQVIAGFEKGVPGMNVGGVRRLVLPPSLAYGVSRNGIIPPNATLVFEIELLEVQ